MRLLEHIIRWMSREDIIEVLNGDKDLVNLNSYLFIIKTYLLENYVLETRAAKFVSLLISEPAFTLGNYLNKYVEFSLKKLLLKYKINKIVYNNKVILYF